MQCKDCETRYETIQKLNVRIAERREYSQFLERENKCLYRFCIALSICAVLVSVMGIVK